MKKEFNDRKTIAFLLTFVGGFLEIYSYLYMKAFATTMTGNFVLLIYNFKNANWNLLERYLLPIISFAFGIITVEILRQKIDHKSSLFWRKNIVFLEIILILILPYIYKSIFGIILIAYISAIQIQAFKTVLGNSYMSTMCTGNIRSFCEALINKKKDYAKIYALVLLAFLLGVLIGDLFIIYFGRFSIYLCLINLIFIFYLINKSEK